MMKQSTCRLMRMSPSWDSNLQTLRTAGGSYETQILWFRSSRFSFCILVCVCPIELPLSANCIYNKKQFRRINIAFPCIPVVACRCQVLEGITNLEEANNPASFWHYTSGSIENQVICSVSGPWHLFQFFIIFTW